MGKKLLHLFLLGLLLFTLGLPSFKANAQGGATLWQAWAGKDVSTIGDDNSGSTVAISENILTPDGSPSLQVTPGGTSEETKLAFPVSGADLVDWMTYTQVELEVYLPEENTLNPNKFFMGMADVTGDFAWIDGVFSDTTAQPGWNQIVFKPSDPMRAPKADANYTIFLSFFNADDAGTKTPLTEVFYVGNIYLTGGAAPAGGEEAGLLWSAWEGKDITTLGDDNSGSTFAASADVLTPGGAAALQVTPSGTAEETKVAFPVSGADLQDWTTNSQVELEVYLPEGNTLNPNKFFMGMADVTGDFAWVDGVFSETTAQPGWNRIVFKPSDPMRAPKADANYTIFLSFFSADDAGTKTPLTEPFYLGSIYLSGAEAGATEEAPQAAATAEVAWTPWENKDITTIGDDNTGTTFALSEEVHTPADAPSLQVTPSGSAPETKLAFPVSGTDLQDWVTYGQIELEVFLPEGNSLNPDRFFMGMADVTGDFAWVDGVFSDTAAQPGWNRIVFKPSDPMRAPKADANYTIYFSFFEGANKTPLTESFNLGSVYLTGPEETAAVPAAAEPVVWKVWDAKNPGMLGDDNTGTNFAQSADMMTPEGVQALQIIPSGTTEETKMAFPVSGTNMQDWTTNGQVKLEIYLPPENTLNPNAVFMGIGDLTTEWAWVGGIWGEFQGDSGWTTVTFVLDPLMQKLDVGGTYSVYLAFINLDENQNKTPLTEPFYLGSVYLTPAPEAAGIGGGGAALSEDAVYQREVDLLLSFDDVALVDAVAHETFDYFWYEANPANGLIKDRSTPDSPASIAAVGFGLAAIPVAVDRGWITYDQGYERVLTTLNTFANGGVQGDHGFFYHFIDMETGERVWSSEISSINSALFIAGALTAGQYFTGTDVETLANQLYEQMDWQWMMSNGNMVSMGWKPDIGFLSSFWDHFDESMIIYALAIGSPTHPVPAAAWDNWKRPVNLSGEYIYLTTDPLFVYQFPLIWLDLKNKEDAYANYFNNTVRACQRNEEFSASQADNFATYQNGVWGISASDGPSGYRAYGTGSQDGTVAPYASIACLPFTPDASLAGMDAMLTQYGPLVWRDYGFVSAINADVEWFSTEHIGIDEGDILLMIANYQDNFVWNLFMQNEHIQKALTDMGFVEKESDYAVTPAYLEQAKANN